uniref:Predicted protein n=1 Tax=Hordeum vulgare subsp. vulgare TaxID=112509 RepID=F2CTF5_HORVV|nr:predicted protein [Hordeum vulgare subsp. vulgare]
MNPCVTYQGLVRQLELEYMFLLEHLPGSMLVQHWQFRS